MAALGFYHPPLALWEGRREERTSLRSMPPLPKRRERARSERAPEVPDLLAQKVFSPFFRFGEGSGVGRLAIAASRRRLCLQHALNGRRHQDLHRQLDHPGQQVRAGQRKDECPLHLHLRDASSQRRAVDQISPDPIATHSPSFRSGYWRFITHPKLPQRGGFCFLLRQTGEHRANPLSPSQPKRAIQQGKAPSWWEFRQNGDGVCSPAKRRGQTKTGRAEVPVPRSVLTASPTSLL